MSQPPQGPGWGNPPGNNPFDPSAGGSPQQGGWGPQGPQNQPPQGGWPQGAPNQPQQGGWGPQNQPQQGDWSQGAPNQPQQADWGAQAQQGGWPQGGPEGTQAYPPQGPFGGDPNAGAAVATKAGLSKTAKGLIAGGVALAVVGTGTAVVVADPMGWRGGGDGDWLKQVPASATMVAGMDLEPGAGQQLEMIRFALKFPSVRENLSLTEGSDPRETAFNALVEDRDCGMTFANDIDPWFGSEIGFFVPIGGSDMVTVIEAKQEEPARAAITKLDECGVLYAGSVAYNDGFLLVGTEEGTAEAALAEASNSDITQRAEFREDMDQLGASGIATFWADAQGLSDTGISDMEAAAGLEYARSIGGTLRFSAGNPEVMVVTKTNRELPKGQPTSLGDLPGDTALAFGLGGGKNFVPMIDEALAAEGMGIADLGLSIPELETLLGDDFVIAVERFDPATLSDPTDAPIALRIKTDTNQLRALERRLNTVDLPVVHLDNNGTSVVSLSNSYAQRVQSPSSRLADQPGFKAAIPEPDKAEVAMYLDIASFAELIGDEADLESEDLQVLQAVGASSWSEGNNYQRGTIRLTAQ